MIWGALGQSTVLLSQALMSVTQPRLHQIRVNGAALNNSALELRGDREAGKLWNGGITLFEIEWVQHPPHNLGKILESFLKRWRDHGRLGVRVLSLAAATFA